MRWPGRIRKTIGAAVAQGGRLLRRPFVWGVGAGILLVLLIRGGNTVTSTDSFCEACHTHPQATSSWIQSTHYATKSGTVVHCVECHLPPGGVAYAVQKTRLGIRDAFGAIVKDRESFDWEERSQLEHARPVELTDKGEEAHLHYERHSDEVRCLNCHLHVGHYDPDAAQEIDFGLVEVAEAEVFDAPAVVEGFVDYTEFHTVTVSSFWMGRLEVTWDEFEAWYRATKAEGRTDTRRMQTGGPAGVDAITGATPPYVPPDQGWGKGDRPAITMTHPAAQEYLRWLSMVTGKSYRLPTEAEWEYAARARTQTPYFFEGNPKQYTEQRFWNRLLGTDTEVLDSFVIHAGNSGGRTRPPSEVAPNPFGLVNMLGNVREFCLDWYGPDAYRERSTGTALVDPRGPATGTEHVVRGGSFRSDPADLRSAARDRTRSEACRMTDPQAPKSIWWYSDCIDVGFRVVRETTREGDLR